ncbi:MAG: hypothetical protein ACPGUV_07420 [Polyangiales bacterium]
MKDVAKAAKTDYAMGVVFWPGQKEKTLDGVVAMMTNQRGQKFPGQAAPVSGKLDEAKALMMTALNEVLKKQRVGPGPWLEVEGTQGAHVIVDSKIVGVVPYYKPITPGKHTIFVRLRHRSSPLKTFHAPYNDSAEVKQKLFVPTEAELAPPPVAPQSEAPPAAPAADAPRSGGVSPLNYAIGGGLAAVGIPFLVSGIASAARDGDCTEFGVDLNCANFNNFGARGKTFLALGSVLTAASVVMFAWRPLRMQVSPSASASGAGVLVQGRF